MGATKMKKNNISNLILTALVLVALAVGVVLVRQSQELRRGASFTTASLNLWPSDRIEARVGDQINVRIKYQALAGKLVDAVQTAFCYDSNIELDKTMGTSGVIATPDSGYDVVAVSEYANAGGKSCVLTVLASQKPSAQLKDNAELGKVYFKAMTAGTGLIAIDQSRSMMSGDNPGSLDKEVTISNIAGTSFTITGVDPTGPGPVLNYKVSFNGILKGNQCANNMKARLTVKSATDTKSYDVVELTRTSEVNSKGYSIYTGSKVLSTFTSTSAVAAFFKGSKHLQMKYSVNNQNKPYSNAGGELVLTDNKDTSTVYNFSEYPILAGDVNQDGKIDGSDFSVEKTKVGTHKTVVESEADAQYDLDGSCQLNTLDITLLVKSLDEKQEEIY
jgi:hypothetical protein